MVIWKIALRNIKTMAKSAAMIPILIGMPLFQIYIMSKVFNNVNAQMSESSGRSFVDVLLLSPYKDLSISRLYIPATVVMFILITGMIAAATLISEREANILARIFTAPLKKSEILIGNMLGYCITTAIVSFILIVSTSLLLKISWGSIPGISAITLLTVYTAVALGFAFSGLFKNLKIATGVMSMVCILMAFLSGGLTGGETSFGFFSRLTINRWANDAYIKIMEGQPLSSISTNLAVLGIIGTLLLLAAILLYKKENIYE